MSIPVTASSEAFVPACLKGIEGAPEFVFRHATATDKYDLPLNLRDEKVFSYTKEQIRAKTLSELRRFFDSPDMAHNITRLEAYWQAVDEHAAAIEEWDKACIALEAESEEGETVELPPAPELEFDRREEEDLKDLLEEVKEVSERLTKMGNANIRHSLRQPRMMLRMFIASTSLMPKLEKKGDLVTLACADLIIDKMETFARENGVEYGVATRELFTKLRFLMVLSEDEEKNSSAPRSGSTNPKASASKRSTSKNAKSTGRATTAKANGSNL